MNKRNLILIIGVLSIFILIFTGYNNAFSKQKPMESVDSKDDELKIAENEVVSYDTDPIKDEDLLVYLGNEKSENEILLVFDYSCQYCHLWIQQIFPTINTWIEEGTVKFRTQTMAFVNEDSLVLSRIDQNIKREYPDYYFSIFFDLMRDIPESDWNSTMYIDKLIQDYHLNEQSLLKEPEIDALNLTRRYTRELDIDSVPSVFVNGQRVGDVTSIEEIQSLLK